MQNRQSKLKTADVEYRNKIRRDLRAKRQGLSSKQQQRARKNLNKQLQLRFRLKSGLLSAYIADDGEIDPMLFLQQLRGKPVQIYLPWVDFSGRLKMLHWKPGRSLRVGRWGILHPSPARSRHLRSVRLLNHILLPMVAFDSGGNRLGRGGGFYDKILACCPGHTRRIGLAHDFQRIASIPTATWDQSLHEVITDTRHECFKQR